MASTTVITQTIAKICLMIDMLYSIDLLLIGGNRPGGGFIGGVLCAAGIGLIYVAYGVDEIKKIWNPDWHMWFGYGLLFASITAWSPLFAGHKYFRSAWDFIPVEIGGIHLFEMEFVSSGFFDLGVYFVVIGGLLFIATKLGTDKSPEGENE
jgi:multicomponent Na+:H+ antiporter subunit B